MPTKVELLHTLNDKLEASAMRSIARLSAVIAGRSPLARELRTKFEEAIADISSVKFEALGPKTGSFFISKGILKIANAPVAELLFAVIDGVVSDDPRGDLDPEQLFELFDRVLAGYVFHELRHRTQGVEVYQNVAAIRDTGGAMVMAQLDTMADRDAAVAVAATGEASDRDEFLKSFQEALYLSTAFYFRVFPAVSERPDKIARALGVLLMLARLAVAETPKGFRESSKFPLDVPLFAYVRNETMMLTVWRGEPSPTLLGACNDTDAIADLVADVVGGRFDNAISKCIALLRRMRVIR